MKKFSKNTAIGSVRRELSTQIHEAELAMCREWRPLPTYPHVKKPRRIIGLQAALKQHRNRMRELARLIRPYDPSGLFEGRTNGRIKKQSTACSGLISEADLRIIQSKIEKNFMHDVDERITRFLDPCIKQVSSGQLKEPIRMDSALCIRLAASYCNAVRDAVSAYATDVIRALGYRQYIRPGELQAFLSDVNRIIERQISNRTASALIKQLSNYLRIDNYKGAATRVLVRALTRFSMPVKKIVADDVRWHLAIHGISRSHYDATPAQKLADPHLFPTMTVVEAMQVLNRSRSTIYRCMDDGNLEPGRMCGTVMTASVAALLRPKR